MQTGRISLTVRTSSCPSWEKCTVYKIWGSYWDKSQWCSWLKQCATSRKVASSILDGVTGIFHEHNPSGLTIALGSTHTLIEMRTSGKGDRCLELTTLLPSCAHCIEMWEPQTLEPSWPVQACIGIVSPLLRQMLFASGLWRHVIWYENYHNFCFKVKSIQRGIFKRWSSSLSYFCHGVGPLVEPFRSHVSRSLFKGLPRFLLPVGHSVSLPWVIYFEAFYLHVVSSFSCIPVNFSKIGVIFNVNLHRLTKHTHVQSSNGDGDNDSKRCDLLEIPRTLPV